MEKREELKQPPKPETIRLTFSEISTKYLEDCKARFQKNTWRQKSFVYSNFLTFLQCDPFIDDATKQDFTDYLKFRREEQGNIAANRDLKEFRSLFNWSIRNDFVLKSPCKHIEYYPEEKTPRYVPPAEDINKVFMVADREDMDLLFVLYHTAGRASEALKLTWEDVNFEQRWVKLWTRKRKNGELQEDKLAMTDSLFDVLKRRWNNRDKSTPFVFHNDDGSKLTYQQKANTMKRLCKKAGVKRFGFHALRHHVASILADSGKASLPQIQKMLRHRRVTTTDNYIKTLDSDLKQVAEVLESNFATYNN